MMNVNEYAELVIRKTQQEMEKTRDLLEELRSKQLLCHVSQDQFQATIDAAEKVMDAVRAVSARGAKQCRESASE